jgi:hypothetical protein
MLHNPSAAEHQAEGPFDGGTSQLGTEPLAPTGAQGQTAALSILNDSSVYNHPQDFGGSTPPKKYTGKKIRMNSSPNYAKRRIGASLNNA